MKIFNPAFDIPIYFFDIFPSLSYSIPLILVKLIFSSLQTEQFLRILFQYFHLYLKFVLNESFELQLPPAPPLIVGGINVPTAELRRQNLGHLVHFPSYLLALCTMHQCSAKMMQTEYCSVGTFTRYTMPL